MAISGIVPGVVAAFMLKGIFLLLKQQRDNVTSAVRYIELTEQISYRSISEFLSLKRRSYLNFGLFRTIPVLAVLLPAIGYVEEKYPNSDATKWVTLLTFIVLNLGFDTVAATRILPYTNIRLTHALLAGMTTLTAFAVVLLSYMPFIDLRVFSLEPADLKNNLAASVIAAALVALFFSSNSTLQGRERRFAEIQEKEEFLSQQRDLIELHHQSAINEACSTFELDRTLVVSILIYENLNRPKPVRRIENLLARLPGVQLTVGIAQVRSRKPMSDHDSILKMGQILWESWHQKFADLDDECVRLQATLTDYNGSVKYSREVIEIMRTLQREDEYRSNAG